MVNACVLSFFYSHSNSRVCNCSLTVGNAGGADVSVTNAFDAAHFPTSYKVWMSISFGWGQSWRWIRKSTDVSKCMRRKCLLANSTQPHIKCPDKMVVRGHVR
ncbi:hypothetical protein Salat_2609000 [Sesamum alatum]|uniref:Uncharacterized protein n=1 Tax=Sesamum alatum TaxID=300844 RepID=A0AAE1XP28_9LAMI|nr:hypothetical protein Salat_2609000 [Sesamum alatum]